MCVPLAIAVAAAAGHGAPSGDFSLITDGFGSVFGGTLTNGTFSGSVSALPGGTYNFRAHYAGDAMFAGSNSNNARIRVRPEESSLNPVAYSMLIDGVPVPISALGNSISYGFPLAFEIDVQGKSGVGSATGKDTITLDDTTVVGTIPLAKGGTGFVYYPDLDPLPGQHHFTVTYGGDNSFQPATVGIPVRVKQGVPEAFIDTVPTTVTEGAPVKLFITVFPALPLPSTPEAPGGTVDLCDNGQKIAGPIQLAQHGLLGNVGQAIYTAHLVAGSHALSLTYSGDANYQSGLFRSFPAHVTVNPATGAAAKVTLEQSPSTINVGQAVNYVMTVRPLKAGGSTPTGTVTLISVDGFTQSPPVPLVNGNATFTQPYYASGVFLDNASYSGDSTYSPSNSINLLTHVNQLVPAVTLTAAAPVVQRGQRTSVTVSVIGQPANPNLAIPAGLVGFFDSVDEAPEHQLSSAHYLTIGNGGNAIYTLPIVLSSGTHVIRAEYLGSTTSPILGDPNDWTKASSNQVTIFVR